MRLSIRYENQFQSIELNEEETQEMWVSLSLEGENLEKGKKSMAFSLRFQDSERTLEEKDIEPLIQNIIEAIQKEFKGELRS